MRATTEELAQINALLPPGATVMADQVEVLPFRVFDTLQTDRHTIMTPEMMRAVLRDFRAGRSAMNAMHQSRSTLPVGRSIDGVMRPIQGDRSNFEVLAKLYTVIKNPDGTVAEDGKILADKYNTGAVYACSAGVNVGLYKCSICGNDFFDYENCRHYPGQTYLVDEKPQVCMLHMTGRDIVDGPDGPIANDCGCYEVSAVTAGGVNRASVLTETFQKYSGANHDETNTVELKKEITAAGKERFAHHTITIYPSTETFNHEEEPPMADLSKDDVLALVRQEQGAIYADKAKVEVELATLRTTFESTKADLTSTQTEFETLKTANTALKTEFDAFKTTHETAKVEFDAAKADNETLKGFQTAYAKIVEAAAVAAGQEPAEGEYAALTLEQLNEKYATYRSKVETEFAAGRITVVEGAEATAKSTYAGVSDDVFKIGR